MGAPVVHFEIVGKDGDALKGYYAELFGWNVASDNPFNYGMVERDDNVTADGIGIGGGICAGPEGYDGHVTIYVQVDDVEASLAGAERLGGTRIMGPDSMVPGMVLGQFRDPEGHVVGLMCPTE